MPPKVYLFSGIILLIKGRLQQVNGIFIIRITEHDNSHQKESIKPISIQFISSYHRIAKTETNLMNIPMQGNMR